MNREKERTKNGKSMDRARDELFSHIHRCGVIQAGEDHQTEWITDTIDYLGERYPDLGAEDLDQLKGIGVRFCRPVIRRIEEEPANPPQGEGESAASEAAAA